MTGIQCFLIKVPLLCFFIYCLSCNVLYTVSVCVFKRSCQNVKDQSAKQSYCLIKERIDSELLKRVVSNSSLTVAYLHNNVKHLHKFTPFTLSLQLGPGRVGLKEWFT